MLKVTILAAVLAAASTFGLIFFFFRFLFLQQLKAPWTSLLHLLLIYSFHFFFVQQLLEAVEGDSVSGDLYVAANTSNYFLFKFLFHFFCTAVFCGCLSFHFFGFSYFLFCLKESLAVVLFSTVKNPFFLFLIFWLKQPFRDRFKTAKIVPRPFLRQFVPMHL